MSISELFEPNYYDLFCNSITTRTGSTGSNPNFVATFRGPWGTTGVTGTVQLSINQDIATITFPSVVSSGVTGAAITMTNPANLPVGYIPASQKQQGMLVIDDGVQKTGLLRISSAGVVTVFTDVTGALFTPGGQPDGFIGTSVTYGLL